MADLSAEKATVRRYYEAVNDADVAVIDEIFAPGYVDHTAEQGGIEVVRSFVQNARNSFPDVKLTPDFQIAEGDLVTTYYTTTGTHRNSWNGIPATNKTINTPGIHIFRLTDGKIVEGWHIADAFGMMTQIGALPRGR